MEHFVVDFLTKTGITLPLVQRTDCVKLACAMSDKIDQ